jgi:hypothetical protein
MRLLQTNLREIDIPLDPVEYARVAADFGANVVLFNVGGIVANYPTRLPFHYPNPRLKVDLIPDLIEQLHSLGIRLIARFDFSKVNQEIGSQNPDWLYRSLSGEAVTYNGQMHCCVNGLYQQNCSLEILKEALGWYPFDGVFFNMIGYQTSDYSGVYHGPCQCDNCRRRFHEFCDQPLPTSEDKTNPSPVYAQYLRFCDETSRELFLRIRDTIKSSRPDCAICTYVSDGIDIMRSESNSGIRRPQPEFIYDASLNVRRVRASWPEKASSNAAVHFVDFPYRHAGVSPDLTARRLAQNLVHGGWMDYYVIGRLDQQHDRACQSQVRELFALHRRAENWLKQAHLPLADIALIEANPANPERNLAELRGLISLLSESHCLYDVVAETALLEHTEADRISVRLSRYPVVIVPDIPNLSRQLVTSLEDYVAAGGNLLLTGRSCLNMSGDLDSTPSFDASGITALNFHPYTPGTYAALNPGDHVSLPVLTEIDWLPIDTPWLECIAAPAARTYLRHIPAGMFGPPEKCYYTADTQHPGIILHAHQQGVCTTVTWNIGSQYSHFPTHAAQALLRSLLLDVIRLRPSVLVDAPPLVEIAAAVNPSHAVLLIGAVNLSGQNGRAVHAPLPIMDIRFTLPARWHVHCVEVLGQGEVEYKRNLDGSTSFCLPRLDLVELIQISLEESL